MSDASPDRKPLPTAQPIEEIPFEPARGPADGSRRARIVLTTLGVTVLAILGTALWFVFTARSVQIAIEPASGAGCSS